VCQENVLEPVLLNVFELMEPCELVDGTDVEVVVEVAQQGSDAEMEPVNATPTVKTNIVVMMVVEELVVLALMELFAKEPQTISLNNATSIVRLISELKSENSEPTLWFLVHAELM
jgi:hypothetical protein